MTPPPSDAGLPAGFRVRADPATRWLEEDRALVGGHPVRLLRLSRSGASTYRRWMGGDPVAGIPAEQALARRLLDGGLVQPAPPPASPRPSVSVVVPTYGRPAALRGLLAGLLSSGLAGGQVLVVDDAGPDDAGSEDPDGSRPTGPGLRYLRRASNGGPAAARNTGWREATDEIVLFLDNDCRLGETFDLDLWLSHFGDPMVGAVGPRVLSADPSGRPPAATRRDAALAAYDAGRGPLDRGDRAARVEPGSPVPFLPGAALAVRRAALEEVGGFDEALRLGEDVDLIWRIGRAGWAVRYEPRVGVLHEPRTRLRPWLAQRFAYGTSAAALDRRHPGAVAPLSVSGWTALAWSLAGTANLAGVTSAVAVVAVTTAALAPRLKALRHPVGQAVRLAGGGHLRAGAGVVEAVRRVWWPLLVPYAFSGRRRRWLAAGLVVLPPLIEAARFPRHRRVGWATWWALRNLEDISYGAGVWVGCWRQRRWGPLVPRWGRRGRPWARLGPPGPGPAVRNQGM